MFSGVIIWMPWVTDLSNDEIYNFHVSLGFLGFPLENNTSAVEGQRVLVKMKSIFKIWVMKENQYMIWFVEKFFDLT